MSGSGQSSMGGVEVKIQGLEAIADRLNITVSTLQYHKQKGNIKLRKIGSWYYWADSEYLDQWRNQHYNPKYTGEELRYARLSLGYTVKNLAEAIGVTTHCVYYWENDVNIPLPKNMAKLESVLF